MDYNEWRNTPMTTEERQESFKSIGPAFLCRYIRECVLPNCGPKHRRFAVTYDESLIHVLVPLLLEIIERYESNMAECDSTRL